MPETKEYRSPDFLADVKDIFAMTAESLANVDWKAKGKALFGLGNRPVKDAFDQTVEPITKAISGFLRGVSEEQQKNYKLMSEMDPSKGVTEEQLGAIIAETINIATITKSAAVKQLAADFRTKAGHYQDLAEKAFEVNNEALMKFAQDAKKQLKTNYPNIVKGVRALSDKMLAPIESVGLIESKVHKGVTRAKDMETLFSVSPGVDVGPEVVAHEALHIKDIDFYKRLRASIESSTGGVEGEFPKAAVEANAYEFGRLFKEAFALKGNKGSFAQEELDQLINQAQRNVVQKWGPDIYNYDLQEVVKHYVPGAKGAKLKGNLLEAKTPDVEEEIKEFAKANNVNFQGKWEDMKGWLITDNETKSSALVRSKEDAQKAIGKMRGVGIEDLYQLDSLTKEPGFFSKLEETVDEVDFGKKPNAKIDIGQIKGFLQGKGRDVSKTEVENVIGSLEGKVAKDDLLREIAANKTEFKDVVLGEKQVSNVRNFNEFLERYREENPTQNHTYPELQEMFNQESSVKEMKNAKFPDRVEPGAIEGSYRETFVTAPEATKNLGLTEKEAFRHKELYNMPTLTPELDGELADLYIKKRDAERGWADGHSAYKDIPNPIVRLRHNDRILPGTIDDNLTLKARNAKAQEWFKKDYKDLRPAGQKDVDSVVPPQPKKILFIEEMQGPAAAEQSKMPEYLQKRIYDTGVKKALIMAKEGGYDGVAWTTGEMQAKRYSIGKEVDKVVWDSPVGNEKLKFVDIHTKEHGTIKMRLDNSDVVTSGPNEFIGKNISEILPKDLSKKILGEAFGDIPKTDLDLYIGGEGLKKVYNKTLPEKFSKFGKEKVQELQLPKDPEKQSAESMAKLAGVETGDATLWWARLSQGERNSILKLDKGEKILFIPVTPKTSGRFPTYAVLPPAALALNELMKVLPPRTSSEEY